MTGPPVQTLRCSNSLPWLVLVALLHGCAAPPRHDVLRVATLNMAHGRGLAASQLTQRRATHKANVDRIAEVVRRRNPGVLALQEADAASAWSGSFDHVGRLAQRAGYAHTYHGLHFDKQAAGLRLRYGTALLAHWPLLSPVNHTFTGTPVVTKGLVAAEIEFAGRRLVVGSLHLYSKSKRIRQAEAAQVIELLLARQMPILLMGDFNCGWAGEDDALCLIASRLNLRAYEPQAGYLDTFRAPNPRQRVDWILASPELEFVNYHTWAEQLADHLAVEATVRWRAD